MNWDGFYTVWFFYGDSLFTFLNIPMRKDVGCREVIHHLESSHATEVIPHFIIAACTGVTTPFGVMLHYGREKSLHYT